MKADLKQKWIEALRSGEYAQGRGQFHDAAANAFCCLGVLCVTANQPHSVRGILSNIGNWRFADQALGDAADGKSWCAKLASINDDGAPFSTIADYIEANIPAEA